MPSAHNLLRVVFATKDRRPFMQDRDVRYAVFDHIQDNAAKKVIHLINLNGHAEHIHALLMLPTDETLAKIMNLIKGESLFWAQRNLQVSHDFEWQDDYFSVGVSPSHFGKVNNYIFQQEEHHKRTTFAAEYDTFMAYVAQLGLLKA